MSATSKSYYHPACRPSWQSKQCFLVNAHYATHSPLITPYLWTTLWEHNTQWQDMWQLKVHCPGCHHIAAHAIMSRCAWKWSNVDMTQDSTHPSALNHCGYIHQLLHAHTSSTARRSLSLAGGVAEETKLMFGESPEWPVMSSCMSGGGWRWAGQTSVTQLEVMADITLYTCTESSSH